MTTSTVQKDRFVDGLQAAFFVVHDGKDITYNGRFENFPFDTIALAVAQGVTVERVEFADRETLAVLTKESLSAAPKISLSKRLKNKKDIRYVCALYLGHILESEDEDRYGVVTTSQNLMSNRRSKFAAGFAHGLLMPHGAVLAMFMSGLSVAKMARFFGVSKERMFIRLAYLSLGN